MNTWIWDILIFLCKLQVFHAHADYDDGGVDEDAAEEEVLVKVMMEKMISWKMPHPNMMTLRLVIFRNDLARPAVPQEFFYS